MRRALPLLLMLLLAGCASPAPEPVAPPNSPVTTQEDIPVSAQEPSECPVKPHLTTEPSYLTEAQALAEARRVQPDGVWKARFEEAYESQGKEPEPRPAWILEAVFTYGNRTVLVVDARTGEHVSLAYIEPTHMPDAPRPISEAQATGREGVPGGLAAGGGGSRLP